MQLYKILKLRVIKILLIAALIIVGFSYLIYKELPQNNLSFTVNSCPYEAMNTSVEWKSHTQGQQLFIRSSALLDVSQEPVLAHYTIKNENLTLNYVIPECRECWSETQKCYRQLTARFVGIDVNDYKVDIHYEKPTVIQTLIWKFTCKNDSHPCFF